MEGMELAGLEPATVRIQRARFDRAYNTARRASDDNGLPACTRSLFLLERQLGSCGRDRADDGAEGVRDGRCRVARWRDALDRRGLELAADDEDLAWCAGVHGDSDRLRAVAVGHCERPVGDHVAVRVVLAVGDAKVRLLTRALRHWPVVALVELHRER